MTVIGDWRPTPRDIRQRDTTMQVRVSVRSDKPKTPDTVAVMYGVSGLAVLYAVSFSRFYGNTHT